MTADSENSLSERRHSPPIPLDTGGLGEDDMMSFISTHIEHILKPYAENVCELHKTVVDLSNNVFAIQEKTGLGEEYVARMDKMQEGQDKLRLYVESTRQFVDGFIDNSHYIEQTRAMTIQNLVETLNWIKGDMAEVRKNCEDMCGKVAAAQRADQEAVLQLKTEISRVAENLKRTDEAQ